MSSRSSPSAPSANAGEAKNRASKAPAITPTSFMLCAWDWFGFRVSASYVLRPVPSPVLVRGILLGVLDHLVADGGGKVETELVGQGEGIADDVGQLLPDRGHLRRVRCHG